MSLALQTALFFSSGPISRGYKDGKETGVIEESVSAKLCWSVTECLKLFL
jgi:hypothetical protein